METLKNEISNEDINLSPMYKSIKELEKAATKINEQIKVCDQEYIEIFFGNISRLNSHFCM